MYLSDPNGGSDAEKMIVIALLTLDIHIPHAQSLKDKRMILRSLKDRLRANPVTQRVPLLVLAGEADLGDQARLFDGFIPKPLSKSVLASTMAGLGLPRTS